MVFGNKSKTYLLPKEALLERNIWPESRAASLVVTGFRPRNYALALETLPLLRHFGNY
ncbi:MAG: hypothetical protein ACI9OO_001518 [Bacteroidia bacterium]|jgi:hypothetical protein